METLLIVDDNKVNREILRKILHDDYQIVEASSGKEAIKLLNDEKNDFSLILLDLVMPGMDGYRVMEIVHDTPHIKNIPIVVQTGKTDNETETKCLKLGARDFIRKPYNPEAIKTRIKNVIMTYLILKQSKLEDDDLTGLTSIKRFYNEITDFFHDHPDKTYDIIAMDIMNFHLIQETHGEAAANELLVTITSFIKEERKQNVFLASRIYGSRFIFMRERNAYTIDALVRNAQHITDLYADKMNVLFKFGIYEVEDIDENCTEMCSKALSAISVLKDNYKTQYNFYDEQMHQAIIFEEKITDGMQKGIDHHQFVVYLQPKYDMHSSSIVGAEALVRWEHPELGLIPPGEFIPIFEKNGFISTLDMYVWEETAKIIRERIDSGERIIPISVNISRKDIEDIDVVEFLMSIVEKYAFLPELLRLEITESAYMQDENLIQKVCNGLKNKGFIIEMDDFGSGYSSLSMLAKLPIDIIKLDMNFIQSIRNSENAKTIVEYTIGLAKWMNIPIIAEGVETESQLDFLKKFDCDYVQGYIFSRPIPVKDFFELVKSFDEERVDIQEKTANNKMHMLIIDDLKLNREIVKSYFDYSFKVIECSNGLEAIDYLKDHIVDIIILDVYMPTMDGFRFLEVFKKTNKNSNIPILVISSVATNEDVSKVYELGADAFIAKPFSSETVVSKVQSLLHMYNKLEDMSSWEYKYFAQNPLVKNLYQRILLFKTETLQEVITYGEKLVTTHKTLDDYQDILPITAIKEGLKTKMSASYFQGDMLIEYNIISIQNQSYIVVFSKNVKIVE